MARPRQTITRDSVFRKTGVTPTTGTRPLQGLPAKPSVTRQTAVWLADEEIVWLDTHIQAIKRAGWRTVTRSAFIRAIIRAAMEHEPDLDGVVGEEELIQRLGAKR